MPAAAPTVAAGLPRRASRPAIAASAPARLVALAAMLVAPLILASILDLRGQRRVWDDLHWTLTSLAAAGATAWSVRGTTGRIRTVRTAGAAAFGLWLLATLGWVARGAVSTPPSLSPAADVFAFAIALPGVAVLVASVRGRISQAEEAAVYLDSILVVLLTGTLLLHVHGPNVIALPPSVGFVALAYPTAFFGLAGAGLVAFLAVGYPVAPRGGLLLLGGSALIGWAYLDWIVPTMTGAAAGELPSVLFSIGTLVGAFGAATWSDALATDEGYRRLARIATRILGPTVAACVLLTLVVPVEPAIDPLVRGGVFLAAIALVVRQGLLLKERTATLAALTRLTAENARLVSELRTELERRGADQRRMIQSSRAAAVGDLAAGVAHEVNNPLTGILGFSELVLADLRPNDPHRADLETIRDEALRARRIVRALRDFAAPAPPQLEPTDLADLIHRTVDLTRYPIERRGVTIHEDLAALPPIQLDGRAIQQAILNVVTNAGQAVADDGRIEITLRADPETGDAVIAIADDGVGMDQRTAELAFEPFFTGRPDVAGVAPSRGLGLSTASGLIESHGGTIAIDSWPDRGTTVEVRLPLRPPLGFVVDARGPAGTTTAQGEDA